MTTATTIETKGVARPGEMSGLKSRATGSAARHRRCRALLFAVALSLLAADAADARRGKGGGISSDEAAALVRSHSGGRILGVRPANSRNASLYRVRVLLSGGRVRVYRVDGRSGKILK